MFSYSRLTFFVTALLFVPVFRTHAVDFDQDGLADFVLVEIGDKEKLNWFAVDINDGERRFLGEFGKAGHHLAVGEWSGQGVPSKALVKKKNSGEFEWDIELPGGKKSIVFGSDPAKVISGMDVDANSSLDPAVVTAENKALIWRTLINPALNSSLQLSEFAFGTKKTVPFYASINGNGDFAGTAKLNKKKKFLDLRYKSPLSGQVSKKKVPNFSSEPNKVLPVKGKNNKDVIFVIRELGSSFEITIVKGKKKVKKVKAKGDEIVVGNYLGVDFEVAVVRKSPTEVIIIYPTGEKSLVPLNLSGILVDEININSFSAPKNGESGGGKEEPGVPVKEGTNPPCSGVMDSRDHLLYKPVSDTSGNAVLVFDGRYKREFKSVKIELRNGSYEEAWWKGLLLWGNPDSTGPRQHWRTNRKHHEIKDGAMIIAEDGNQTCRFVLPGSSSKRWE